MLKQKFTQFSPQSFPGYCILVGIPSLELVKSKKKVVGCTPVLPLQVEQ